MCLFEVNTESIVHVDAARVDSIEDMDEHAEFERQLVVLGNVLATGDGAGAVECEGLDDIECEEES